MHCGGLTDVADTLRYCKPMPIEFQSFSLSLRHAMGVHGQWDDLHQCDALWVLLIKM